MHGITEYGVSDLEILEKLGMAIYMHRALIKQAERARDAVDYLAEMGVWDAPQDAPEVRI